jgi:hypothetical protein
MTTTQVLMAEGVSDSTYLSALDRRIDDLAVRRRLFLTAAHELSHRGLEWNGANSTGMTAVFDALDLTVAPAGLRLRTGPPARLRMPCPRSRSLSPSFAVIPLPACHLGPPANLPGCPRERGSAAAKTGPSSGYYPPIGCGTTPSHSFLTCGMRC